MSRNYIDFISSYCDRWCERCGLTERCSQFALTAATAMCDGDFEAALELAIGRPQRPAGPRQKKLRERMADAVAGYEEPSAKELEEIGRELDQREARVNRHPLAEASRDYSVVAHRWLDGVAEERDSEALSIVRWDLYLIHAKIDRALTGRDEFPDGAWFEPDAVQSDWNGSAKVALISIERSERAWRSIAATCGHHGATTLADMLAGLRDAAVREFPRAMEFRRPGFDDPPRDNEKRRRQER